MAVPFEKIYEAPDIETESPDQYCAGRLSPVYLGDVLNDRYKIFRKLGYGSQSTVWLAKDLKGNGYVAVKVYSARADDRVPGEMHHTNVERLRDHFFFDGPNGRHACAVLEPLGRSLGTVITQAISIAFGRSESPDQYQEFEPHRWSIKLAREICRQILVGLHALHSQKVAHRDIQPGNVAFALSYDIDSLSMSEIQENGAWVERVDHPKPADDWDAANLKGSEGDIAWTRRLDHRPLGPTEIKYTVRAAPLHDRLVFDNFPQFRILLIDLGFSQPFEKCDQPLKQPSNYRPPESILPMTVTYKADIFTAGLVFWEIVMNRNFVWTHWLDGRYDNAQYLKDLAKRVGPLPARFQEAFPPDASGEEDEELDEEDLAYGDMLFAARRDRPVDMSDGEVEVFVDLTKRMMQWEPEQRASTQELLKHPFFDVTYTQSDQ